MHVCGPVISLDSATAMKTGLTYCIDWPVLHCPPRWRERPTTNTADSILLRGRLVWRCEWWRGAGTSARRASPKQWMVVVAGVQCKYFCFCDPLCPMLHITGTLYTCTVGYSIICTKYHLYVGFAMWKVNILAYRTVYLYICTRKTLAPEALTHTPTRPGSGSPRLPN